MLITYVRQSLNREQASTTGGTTHADQMATANETRQGSMTAEQMAAAIEDHQGSLTAEKIAEDDRRRERELYGPATPPRESERVTPQVGHPLKASTDMATR